MVGFTGRCGLFALALGIATLAPLLPASSGEPPRRVVSMNLCTDQLAMMIAGEDQLYSVSHLAGDPASSVLADQAKNHIVNHGLAEEIFLMHPDLVLAGTYTTRATVDMLRRLGFRVEEFAPETSFADIRTNVRRMGELLGREERAEELIAAMDDAIATLSEPETRKTVALYFANGYSSGKGTLADEVVTLAGFRNLAADLQGIGRLPLETLVMARPDLLVGENRQSAPALAYQNYDHPALRAVANDTHRTAVSDKYWVCGAPFTVDAVRQLSALANERNPGPEHD
ncbi:MAG: ABC transporter substrate-binding protein [Phyllobacterium sp.]